MTSVKVTRVPCGRRGLVRLDRDHAQVGGRRTGDLTGRRRKREHRHRGERCQHDRALPPDHTSHPLAHCHDAPPIVATPVPRWSHGFGRASRPVHRVFSARAAGGRRVLSRSRRREPCQPCNLGRAARGQLLHHSDAPDVELLVDHAGLQARPLERTGGVREGSAPGRSRRSRGRRASTDPRRGPPSTPGGGRRRRAGGRSSRCRVGRRGLPPAMTRTCRMSRQDSGPWWLHRNTTRFHACPAHTNPWSAPARSGRAWRRP